VFALRKKYNSSVIIVTIVIILAVTAYHHGIIGIIVTIVSSLLQQMRFASLSNRVWSIWQLQYGTRALIILSCYIGVTSRNRQLARNHLFC